MFAKLSPKRTLKLPTHKAQFQARLMIELDEALAVEVLVLLIVTMTWLHSNGYL